MEADPRVVLGVITLIKRQFPKLAQRRITAENHLFDDLRIDFLTMVEIIMAAEEEFDIQIDDADVKYLATVNDLAAYISSRSKDFAHGSEASAAWPASTAGASGAGITYGVTYTVGLDEPTDEATPDVGGFDFDF